MNDTPCCNAMMLAISNGFVEWPITYNRDKQMSRLTPVLPHPDAPALMLDYCPWCRVDVRISAQQPFAAEAEVAAQPAQGTVVSEN